MKVDINVMEGTAEKMHRLGEQIQRICAQLEETKSNLKHALQDSAMVSVAIVTSLTHQIRELEQRSEGANRMSNVLVRAAEEYRTCEERSTEHAKTAEPILWRAEINWDVMRTVGTIPMETEQAVYAQYIAPLIKFEKREKA